MHRLQTKNETEDQYPNTQVQYATNQFMVGNFIQRTVFDIHPRHCRQDISVARDSDNHRAVVVKFYGQLLSQSDIAKRVYTDGNMRIQGGNGKHDGHQVLMATMNQALWHTSIIILDKAATREGRGAMEKHTYIKSSNLMRRSKISSTGRLWST
jgi:hypothetical protein